MARGPSDSYEKAKMEPVSSPGVRQGKPMKTNIGGGRVTLSRGGSNIEHGDLAPRNSAPIINKPRG